MLTNKLNYNNSDAVLYIIISVIYLTYPSKRISKIENILQKKKKLTKMEKIFARK